MIKWTVRGKYNKKATTDYQRKHYNFEDGQYIYLAKTRFGEKNEATLFKKKGGAKGALTHEKKCVEEGWYSRDYVEDLEIIEVTVLFPED